MRILVLQHIACEHPGIFRQFLAQDGLSYDAVELDEGEQITNLDSYDVMWVMGGPMDVWDVVAHPWLIEEKRVIHHWVNTLKRPYLGLCLGHQLLADALGGTCGPQIPGEIGILDVELTPKAAEDPVFAGLPKLQKALQWHSVQVAQAPENAVILAHSPACPIQAMRVNDCAWSMQYHVELEADTIANWGDVPAYAKALSAAKGEGAIADFIADSTPHMADFSANAQMIYRNFMTFAQKPQ